MGFGFGSGFFVGGSGGFGFGGNSLPRSVTDYFNGFELSGSTYSGGTVVTEDNTGALVTSPAGVLPLEGMRLSGSTWLPTTSLGDPIHASTPLRTKKGTVSKYAESYKGPLIEPARTNYFLNSTVPITQNITTTAQKYTVSVKGTGNITLSGTATGVATDGSPLTVTATEGTLTCTVAGTLSRVNVEAGAFGTSFIDTGATTVTRPAANLTRPTAGTALESGNNFAIYGRVVPKAAGQVFRDLLSSYVGGGNYISVYTNSIADKVLFNKVGLNAFVETLYTPTANTPFEYLTYQHSVHGMGIAVRSWNGSAWSAWSAWATNANTQNAPIASTYQIGARSNTAHFAANYPFTEIIRLNPNLHPQTQLADLLAKGRI